MDLRGRDRDNEGDNSAATGSEKLNQSCASRTGAFLMVPPTLQRSNPRDTHQAVFLSTVSQDVKLKTRREIAEELDKAKRDLRAAKGNVQKYRATLEQLSAEKLKTSFRNNRLEEHQKELEKEVSECMTAYRKLEEEHNSLWTKHNFSEIRYIYVIKHLFRPYASANDMSYDDHSAATMKKILRPLLEDATTCSSHKAKVEALEAQVLSLQQQLLSNVKKIDPVPDDVFATEFRQLVKTIKGLSRQIKVSSPDALIRIDGIRRSLLVDQVEQEDLTPPVRMRPIVEAFIWSVLYSDIFCNPFHMFDSLDLANGFVHLFGEDHQHKWPSPTASTEQWRLTSMEQLVRQVGEEVITTGIVQGKSPHLEANIQRVRSEAKNVIIYYLTSASPGTNFSRVDTIVDKAFSLALHIFLQRCRIQVVYPQIGDVYEKDLSHLDTIAESIEVEKGSVALIACPGLAKWGDGEGKNLDQRLDLVPAMVLAKPVANGSDEKKVQMERFNSQKDEYSARNESSTPKIIHPKVVIPSKPRSEHPMVKTEDTEMADDVQW